MSKTELLTGTVNYIQKLSESRLALTNLKKQRITLSTSLLFLPRKEILVFPFLHEIF